MSALGAPDRRSKEHLPMFHTNRRRTRRNAEAVDDGSIVIENDLSEIQIVRRGPLALSHRISGCNGQSQPSWDHSLERANQSVTQAAYR